MIICLGLCLGLPTFSSSVSLSHKPCYVHAQAHQILLAYFIVLFLLSGVCGATFIVAGPAFIGFDNTTDTVASLFQNTFDETLTYVLLLFVTIVLGAPTLIILSYAVAINELLRCDVGALLRQEYSLKTREARLTKQVNIALSEAENHHDGRHPHPHHNPLHIAREAAFKAEAVKECRELLRALIDMLRIQDGRLRIFGFAPNLAVIYGLAGVSVTAVVSPLGKWLANNFFVADVNV